MSNLRDRILNLIANSRTDETNRGRRWAPRPVPKQKDDTRDMPLEKMTKAERERTEAHQERRGRKTRKG